MKLGLPFITHVGRAFNDLAPMRRLTGFPVVGGVAKCTLCTNVQFSSLFLEIIRKKLLWAPQTMLSFRKLHIEKLSVVDLVLCPVHYLQGYIIASEDLSGRCRIAYEIAERRKP